MKTLSKVKYLFGTIMLAACTLGLTACGDDNDGDNPGGGEENTNGGTNSSATITSNEASGTLTYAYAAMVEETSDTVGRYYYEIEFSDVDVVSYYISGRYTSLPKKATIASLAIRSNQKFSGNVPTGTFAPKYWGMSGAINVPLSNEYEYEVTDGMWYFDAVAIPGQGNLTITKSGDTYTVAANPLIMTWRKHGASSENDYNKMASFKFTGKIVGRVR